MPLCELWFMFWLCRSCLVFLKAHNWFSCVIQLIFLLTFVYIYILLIKLFFAYIWFFWAVRPSTILLGFHLGHQNHKIQKKKEPSSSPFLTTKGTRNLQPDLLRLWSKMAGRFGFSSSSPATTMIVTNTPAADLALTNLAYCSPTDLQNFAIPGTRLNLASVGDAFVLTVSYPFHYYSFWLYLRSPHLIIEFSQKSVITWSHFIRCCALVWVFLICLTERNSSSKHTKGSHCAERNPTAAC